MDRQQNGRWAQGRSLTLWVTNAIKVGGLVLAIHSGFSKAGPTIAQMGEAIFMMAGAQITEEQILNLAAKMFGTMHTPERTEPGSEHSGGERERP